MADKKPKKNVKFVPGEKFVLTERSHRDALRLDDEAPQKVFVPYNEASGSKGSTSQAQKSYQRFLGVEFEDDTDYLKCMKANPDNPNDEFDGLMSKDEIYEWFHDFVLSSYGVKIFIFSVYLKAIENFTFSAPP